MKRHCLKHIDDEGTITCARDAGHESDPKDYGCCAHMEEVIGDGRSNGGRLRRKCLQCGDKFLVSEHVGQEYLREEELCYEASLICHSDVSDYEFDEEARTVNVRKGVNPDATRAISSMTFKRRFDARTENLIESEVKITLWSKTETITLAGKRFNAFPSRFEVSAADELLEKLTGVPKGELPPAE